MKKKSDTLHLVLKAKWYNMIASGEKKEEYRDITLYWKKRLLDWDYPQPIAYDFEKDEGCCWGKHDYVCFHRGYTNLTMTFELTHILIGKGRTEWGAPKGKDVFIIQLGKVVSKKMIMNIDDFCNDCRYYDPGNDNSCYSYCCTHPDNVEDGKFGQCTAGGCPLAGFAEERDFLEAGLSKEDVDEDSVFVYIGAKNG